MQILTFVLAGGEGTRLRPLTNSQPKPALPFVNGYRIIDFVLSNLLNSGITSIYVLVQYKPQLLTDHLRAAWMPRFRKKGGFLGVICPNTERARERFAGTADAVYKNFALVREHAPEAVAVFAADHIYRMDIRQMADFHSQSSAEVTVAAIPVPIQSASSFGVMRIGAQGRILEFQEKPQLPAAMPGDLGRASVSMGNYLFDPDVLADLLKETKRNGGSDFGHHVMPRLPGRCRTFAYDFSRNALPGIAAHEEAAYWRDVGTVDALLASRSDTLGPQPRFSLHNRAWPIFGHEYPFPADKTDRIGISGNAVPLVQRSLPPSRSKQTHSDVYAGALR